MGKDYSNKSKIERWARKFVFPFDDTVPRAHAFALLHRAANGKVADVQKFGASVDSPDALKALVEEINECVIDDAQGTGGMQNYILLALNQASETISRLALRCQGDTETDDEDSVSSEPATSKGLLSQLMRHNEAQARTLSATLGTVLKAQQATIEIQSVMIEKYASRDLQMIEAREELLSNKHERDMEIAEAERKSEIMGDVAQKFVALLPPIAKKLFGGTVSAEESLEIQELRAMYEGMGEEEREGMRRVMSPERYIAFMSIIESDLEKRTAAKGPNSHSS